MSETYVDLIHTTFPDQLSKQIILRDPTVSEIPLVNQYNALIAQGQKTMAIELLQKNPSLMECIINADVLLKIYHSVIAMERFIFDDTLGKILRLGGIKGDWNAMMSSDAEGNNKLNHFDVIRYPVDGVKQYFMVMSNNIVAGDIPTEHLNTKYLQLSIKGDKGDPGYTPIKGVDYFDGYTPIKDIDYFDGVDGASGIGMSPRGAWVRNKEYYQYDVVSHNGFLWYALEDTTITEPSDESTVWVKFNIFMQVAIGTEIPYNLEEGGIWLHMQDDGHIVMKTKNSEGRFVAMYPETQAVYVNDVTGENLQRKIYRNYFDRDDIKILCNDSDLVCTRTAVLASNNSIVVAKEIMTDTLDENGKVTKEYTAYDESGVYVMYKCKKVLTDYGNGTSDTTIEVII